LPGTCCEAASSTPFLRGAVAGWATQEEERKLLEEARLEELEVDSQ
jgi:hypothetical protein